MTPALFSPAIPPLAANPPVPPVPPAPPAPPIAPVVLPPAPPTPPVPPAPAAHPVDETVPVVFGIVIVTPIALLLPLTPPA